ncbi:hypothetical protein [Xanthomonas bonasiae]|uniref:hypothetical protein n=1 Tax=Xanthomonas bonasiae TaxID=2810351 RepID=UPI0017849298|nr:hypothetical protein [Xanthomonas surreyensis]MBD7923845.1 hypothetical protein [Xanthomonas surreyensis]
MNKTIHSVYLVLVTTFLMLATVEAAEAPLDLQQKARLRLFASSDTRISLRTNASKSGAGELVTLEDPRARGNRWFMHQEENVSIGMPETLATQQLDESVRVKPYYREFWLAPGQLVNVYADLNGHAKCVPAEQARLPERERKISLPPNVGWTPEPGIDYEMELIVEGGRCKVDVRQVLQGGRTIPLPREIERERLRENDYKVVGPHLFVFLLKPGSVFYRVVGESKDLQMMVDGPKDADFFETSMREVATKGAQACIVLPSYDYESPLLARLKHVMDEGGDTFPAIYEREAGLRQAMKMEDDMPTTFAAAASYCQIAALVAFRQLPPQIPGKVTPQSSQGDVPTH